MPDVTTLQPIDPLKVFLEFNEEYQVYVAQCLQTGHLVTADEPDMAKEMITELLEEEVSRAVQANDLSRLLSHPAPMALFFKWDIASQVPSAMEFEYRFNRRNDADVFRFKPLRFADLTSDPEKVPF